MNRYILGGNDWKLAFCPEKGGNKNWIEELPWDSCTWVDAVVPGNVEIDLMRAGVIEDPFYGDNLYKIAPYEYYQWIYKKTFTLPAFAADEELILHFDGVDTYADVYLNGAFVGSCDNMLIEHEFPIAEYVNVCAENTLYVHIHSTMNTARSGEYTMAMRGTAHRNEICHTRKAPHMFGWDIAPRLVSAGIWKDVWVAARKATRITETYYACAELDHKGMYLSYGYRYVTDHDTLEGFKVRVTGVCGEHTFQHELVSHFVSANHDILIENPKLWWPLGYGEQPLYTVTMELLYHDEVIDSKTEQIGLRTVMLERDFTPGKQQFMFRVNNEPIFAKGTNWVPLDALHSRDAERVERAIALCVEAQCNFIRCWGGNVYESDAFFALCDKYGLLVWQDFSMGNTNYPQGSDFVEVLEKECAAVIKRLRNHPSLAIWSGDNEIEYKNHGYRYPTYASIYNRVSKEVLPRLTQAHDPYRFFIQSSPEIPEGFGMYNVPEQHTWGPRAWYKDPFYKDCTAHFISEAGYHGCTAPSSLRKFIPADRLWPLDNDVWAIHSTEDIRIERKKNIRNELMRNQVKLLFGEVPDKLEEFALLSQISQAEAMKFFVERTRGMKWDRTGIIWWNMLDCWPQISDSVVDYYFTKKLAFHYLKRAQNPVLVFVAETEGWRQRVLISNDTRVDTEVCYTVTDFDSGEILLTGKTFVKAGENAEAGTIFSDIGAQKLLLIRYTADGKEYGNHYITGLPSYEKETMLRWLEAIRMLPEAFELSL